MSTVLNSSSKSGMAQHAVICFEIESKGKYNYIDDFKINQKNFGEIKAIKRMPQNDIMGVLGTSTLAIIYFNEEEKLFSYRHFFDNIFNIDNFYSKDFTFAADNAFIIGENEKEMVLGWLKIRRPRTYARKVGELLIKDILKGAKIERGEELPTESKRGRDEVTIGEEEESEYTEDQSMTIVDGKQASALSKKYKTLNDENEEKISEDFNSVKIDNLMRKNKDESSSKKGDSSLKISVKDSIKEEGGE